MDSRELKDRTMTFALDVWRMTRPMRSSSESRHVADQLFRAASAVAANYRAACVGRSRKEFAAKLGIVREEADESVFWLEFVQKAGIVPDPRARNLLAESRELAAIVAAAYKTTRATMKRKRQAKKARDGGDSETARSRDSVI
jgi:four helix bundle protein